MTANVGSLPELPLDTATVRPTSLGRDTLANILRQRSAIAGLFILGAMLLIAIFADVVSTHDPLQSMLDTPEAGAVRRGESPCVHALGCPADRPQHLMGLDSNLRDEFSRVVHGSRISLQVGFVTVGFAIIIGLTLGAVAGYLGAATDNVIMRLLDVVLAFPSLILAIAIVTVLGSGLFQAQLAIAIVSIPIYARVMRASVLATRETDFVAASRALGESSVGILTRRILPNALTPLIVAGTLGIGSAIVEVAALSFLGLGAQQPQAEWGSMIGFDYNLFFSAPHLIIFPGLAITLTVLGFNLLGDGLRDALDPRLNR
jgi:ABC-type dipeptide/oligopeptide/nickel transport system permease subunit